MTMRLLPLLLALLAVSMATATASGCQYHEGDALVDRLETLLPPCLRHAAAVDELQDLVVTNELSRPRRPLAIAAFSSDSEALDGLAASLAGAYFGARRDGMRVVDMLELGLGDDDDDAAVLHAKQTLRRALASTLQRCPRRSLLVLRRADALAGASLPVLDVLLDPLNGERATLQDPATGEELDSRGLVVLLLFRVDADADVDAAPTRHSWREFLMTRWRDHGPVHEAFTPQAVVGRLTAGVRLLPGTTEPDECHGGDRAPAGAAVQWTFTAVLAALVLLVKAKGWAALRRALQKTPRKEERPHRHGVDKEEQTDVDAVSAKQQQQNEAEEKTKKEEEKTRKEEEKTEEKMKEGEKTEEKTEKVEETEETEEKEEEKVEMKAEKKTRNKQEKTQKKKEKTQKKKKEEKEKKKEETEEKTAAPVAAPVDKAAASTSKGPTRRPRRASRARLE
ncbi:hypothetical protein ATCC90586_004899 [Pythium insidiosum]|nr:hypothetical protein ATCC90586_004899 [Pythium insidiosum]